MEIKGNVVRLDGDDMKKLESNIQASEIEALGIKRGEVSLAALRGMFYAHYPMGLETFSLESPMTEMFQQVEEAMHEREK